MMGIAQPPKVAVVGSLNMDVVIEATRAPLPGETVLGERVHYLPGGKGANQAVAAAKLGADTRMIGAVGDDLFGQRMLEAMRDNGISTDTIRAVSQMSTGTAHILLADGDNSIVVVPGANASCSPADLDRHERAIAEADVLLLQLEIPLEVVHYAAAMARRHGVKVILNPAPAQPLSAELLRLADYLTPNRTELARLADMPEAGADEADESVLLQAMRKLQEQGAGNVIVTLGAAGAAILNREQKYATLPGRKVKVVDTTGAGDCFNGSLAYAVAKGLELEQAVRFSIAASALSISKLGAQGGMPSLPEVEALLRETP